jgi:hypothetical protein
MTSLRGWTISSSLPPVLRAGRAQVNHKDLCTICKRRIPAPKHTRTHTSPLPPPLPPRRPRRPQRRHLRHPSHPLPAMTCEPYGPRISVQPFIAAHTSSLGSLAGFPLPNVSFSHLSSLADRPNLAHLNKRKNELFFAFSRPGVGSSARLACVVEQKPCTLCQRPRLPDLTRFLNAPNISTSSVVIGKGAGVGSGARSEVL